MSEIDAAELISAVSRLKSCNWPDAHIVLDALEKARGDLEELVQATTEQTEACIRLVEASQAMKEAATTFKAERDAARALLVECVGALGRPIWLAGALIYRQDLYARISAFLESKP